MSIETSKRTVLALVGLVLVIGISIVLTTNSFVRYRNDFFARWYATTKLLQEQRNLYDNQNGLEVVEYSNFPDATQADFYYPAHLLVFIGPLSLLSDSAALFIWLVAIQLFYLLGIWLVIDKVNWPETIGRRTWYIVLAVFFIPYLQHTFWGQFNTIAVFSLAVTYLALTNNRYFLAGVLASGLTFKPQGTGLILVSLLIWALFRRNRWSFLAGFASASLVLWGIAEIMQPGWIVDFYTSLGDYLPTQSVIDSYWNPMQLISGLLILGSIITMIKNRECEAGSPIFAAELALAFGVWALVVPIVGMMHMVFFPLVLIFVMASLKDKRPKQHRWAHYVFGTLYLLGWIGFIAGLVVPGFYGLHTSWSELAYKQLMPAALILLSLPICLPNLIARWSPVYD